MEFDFFTLLDILNSQQFRTVLLFSLGLETHQIADLLKTNELTVYASLRESMARSGCRSSKELTLRMLDECKNNLYDERRIKRELAGLQTAAQQMLEEISATALPN
ncbi:MAG TPA: hypothetical protein VH437_07235 [Terriglobales bacterium]|jgi:DNA-binding CsgD family transcriptional regulator